MTTDPLEQDNHAFEDRLIDAAEPLPSVAGRMQMTHEDFQRACQVQIQAELVHVMPSNSLIHVLCEAVRCSRECCEIATLRASYPAFPDNSTKAIDKDYELLRLEALKVLPPERVGLALNVADIGSDLVARIQALEQERDLAIKEANRRDQKWIDGINETIGTNLDFHDPCSRNNASKVLGDMVARIQQLERDLATSKSEYESLGATWIVEMNRIMGERDQARAEGAVMRRALTRLEAASNPVSHLMNDICKKALSTTCGQYFLEALKACEELVSYAAAVRMDRPYVHPDWLDTFQLQTEDWCKGLLEHCKRADAKAKTLL